MKRSQRWGLHPLSPHGDTEQGTRRTRLVPPRAGFWGDNRHCFTPGCSLAGSSQILRGCEMSAPPQPPSGWGTDPAPHQHHVWKIRERWEHPGKQAVPGCLHRCVHPQHPTAPGATAQPPPVTWENSHVTGAPAAEEHGVWEAGTGGSVPPNPAARALPWELPACQAEPDTAQAAVGGPSAAGGDIWQGQGGQIGGRCKVWRGNKAGTNLGHRQGKAALPHCRWQGQTGVPPRPPTRRVTLGQAAPCRAPGIAAGSRWHGMEPLPAGALSCGQAQSSPRRRLGRSCQLPGSGDAVTCRG